MEEGWQVLKRGNGKGVRAKRKPGVEGPAFIILKSLLLLSLSSCVDGGEYHRLARERIREFDPGRRDLVVVVDYRKNILRKRLYVIDMATGKTLLSSRVSHARNSGLLYARRYSNVPGSCISSKGTFMTAEPYRGRLGYCMRVDGLEKGVNDKTRSRAIVFHSTRFPYLWSKGCFATPPRMNRRIVDLTRNGTLVCLIDG